MILKPYCLYLLSRKKTNTIMTYITTPLQCILLTLVCLLLWQCKSGDSCDFNSPILYDVSLVCDESQGATQYYIQDNSRPQCRILSAQFDTNGDEYFEPDTQTKGGFRFEVTDYVSSLDVIRIKYAQQNATSTSKKEMEFSLAELSRKSDCPAFYNQNEYYSNEEELTSEETVEETQSSQRVDKTKPTRQVSNTNDLNRTNQVQGVAPQAATNPSTAQTSDTDSQAEARRYAEQQRREQQRIADAKRQQEERARQDQQREADRLAAEQRRKVEEERKAEERQRLEMLRKEREAKAAKDKEAEIAMQRKMDAKRKADEEAKRLADAERKRQDAIQQEADRKAKEAERLAEMEADKAEKARLAKEEAERKRQADEAAKMAAMEAEKKRKEAEAAKEIAAKQSLAFTGASKESLGLTSSQRCPDGSRSYSDRVVTTLTPNRECMVSKIKVYANGNGEAEIGIASQDGTEKGSLENMQILAGKNEISLMDLSMLLQPGKTYEIFVFPNSGSGVQIESASSCQSQSDDKGSGAKLSGANAGMFDIQIIY